MATDFVIAWVNGEDKAWQKKRASYETVPDASDAGECRYRDWGFLPYWFRGVERFAPWVRRVYLVTDGQVPTWLNLSHPKLTVVDHADFLPAEYLPTFNSHTIELNFHRIRGLSEQFVYFNDDMLLLRPVRETRFFQNGKPLDMLALQPVVANRDDQVMPYIYLNNAMTLARTFDKRENMKKQPRAYFHIGYPPLYFFYNMLEMLFPRFTAFYTVHGPSPLLRSTYQELWQKEGALLSDVCRHHFRDRTDVSQYLLREWQKLNGNFVPANVHGFCRYFTLGDENPTFLRAIRRQSCACVCCNDSAAIREPARVKQELLSALSAVLPEKSAFER